MPTSASTRGQSHRVLHLDEVGSTNAEAMRLGQAGDPGNLWVLADRQTAGRGRSGRHWTSEPGDFTASLLLRLSTPAPKAYQLSLVSGVAVIDAIRAGMTLAPEAALRLKWPNDILVSGRKAGGILVESSTAGTGLAAVIGIGLNLVRHPDAMEGRATHLGAYGGVPAPADFLPVLAEAMEHWLSCWNGGQGFPAVRQAWIERAGPIGERVRANVAEKPIEGVYLGLDEDGAMLMRDAQGCDRRVSFGDVTLPD